MLSIACMFSSNFRKFELKPNNNKNHKNEIHVAMLLLHQPRLGTIVRVENMVDRLTSPPAIAAGALP